MLQTFIEHIQMGRKRRIALGFDAAGSPSNAAGASPS
jgi:hypothetical protein